jgi:hypothetical protein
MGTETAQTMTEAARRFLAALEPGQRAKVSFTTKSSERLNWDYRPRERAGLALAEMDSAQQQLMYALLASGLSRSGNTKALSIMSLEKVLGDLEGAGGRHVRDPLRYYVCVFGDLSPESAWGLRLEGHHLSLNFLIAEGGDIAATPNFFGANPAHVFEGPLEGLRVLAAEEDQARLLLASLDENQKKRAVIDEEAPADIITRWEPRVKMDDPAGLAVSEMRGDQEGLLMDLVTAYTGRTPKDVAAAHMNRIEKEGKKYIHFAWAGSAERGRPHYYRLHGPSFLVEYDNTQDNANHIHSVWRDLRNDWGEDLFREHYTRSHGASG